MKLRYLCTHPSCLLGPKIWLASGRSAGYHRRLVCGAWPGHPRWQWGLLLMLNLLGWYLLLGWLSLWRAQQHKEASQSAGSRLGDLIYLVFWLGAPAGDYNRLRLGRRPREAWLDYVYSSEELSWQRLYSCPEGAPSAAVLNDKLAFEQRLNAVGMVGTVTLTELTDSSAVGEFLSSWADELPLFLKPRSANAMRGCVRLSGTLKHPQLEGLDMQRRQLVRSGRAEVEEAVVSLVADTGLLVQRELANAPQMSACAQTCQLVTMRLITGVRAGGAPQVLLAYAILEVPREHAAGWDLYALDDRGYPRDKAADLRGPLPDFDAALAMVSRLHREMADIRTLAWDMCLTERGWTLLEGNTGWGLVAPQAISGIPLLASGLQDCYD